VTRVDALGMYMKDPLSYDGEYAISTLHPEHLRSAIVFVKLRDLSEDALRLIRCVTSFGWPSQRHPVGWAARSYIMLT